MNNTGDTHTVQVYVGPSNQFVGSYTLKPGDSITSKSTPSGLSTEYVLPEGYNYTQGTSLIWRIRMWTQDCQLRTQFIKHGPDKVS